GLCLPQPVRKVYHEKVTVGKTLESGESESDREIRDWWRCWANMPRGQTPNPGNGRTGLPDLPTGLADPGRGRTGEVWWVRDTRAGEWSRREVGHRDRGRNQLSASRAGGSRPDVGDSKSGPASPGSGQRTTEPWWQSRRSETGSKHCPAESQRLTETE